MPGPDTGWRLLVTELIRLVSSGGICQSVRSPVVLAWYAMAAVMHMLLRDRRFHATVITGAIGAVALAELIKNNQARPARRAVTWYKRLGTSQELARARQDPGPGKRS